MESKSKAYIKIFSTDSLIQNNQFTDKLMLAGAYFPLDSSHISPEPWTGHKPFGWVY